MRSINKIILEELSSRNVPVITVDDVPLVNSRHLIGILGDVAEIDEFLDGMTPVHTVTRTITTYDTGPCEIKFLTPKGLTRMFMFSDCPATERFQKWMEDTVLESIFLNGRYVESDGR